MWFVPAMPNSADYKTLCQCGKFRERERCRTLSPPHLCPPRSSHPSFAGSKSLKTQSRCHFLKKIAGRYHLKTLSSPRRVLSNSVCISSSPFTFCHGDMHTFLSSLLHCNDLGDGILMWIIFVSHPQCPACHGHINIMQQVFKEYYLLLCLLEQCNLNSSLQIQFIIQI